MKPNVRHLLPELQTGATTEALGPDIVPQPQRPCSIVLLPVARENGALPSSRGMSRTENVRKWLSRTFSPELREIVTQALAEAWTT
jgi:hypothetical protein